jgi:hypothetical protein
LPPARSAQRPAGDAHAGADRADHVAPGGRRIVRRGLQTPVHCRQRLATPGAKLQVEHVLRVDATGRLQVSSAMQGRLVYVGGQPKALDVIP